MDPALIALASDAIKIGLGAAVGGLFAVLGAGFQHRRSLQAEYNKRVRDTIEQLAERFEKTNSFYLERLAIAETGELQPEHRDKALWGALQWKYRDFSVDLHQMEGRLALLDAIEIANVVQKYRRATRDLLLADRDMSKGPQSLLKEVSETLVECRIRFYELLAKEYKNV
jgi:phage host-nuclease inhibitor protein Gam